MTLVEYCKKVRKEDLSDIDEWVDLWIDGVTLDGNYTIDQLERIIKAVKKVQNFQLC